MKTMLLLLGSILCLVQVSSADVPYLYFDFEDGSLEFSAQLRDGSLPEGVNTPRFRSMETETDYPDGLYGELGRFFHGNLMTQIGLAGIGSESPDDHTWCYDPNQTDNFNEMLQLFFEAGSDTVVVVSSMTLQASGSGNDATDISRIRVVHDVDGDGEDDSDTGGPDILLGIGSYPVDNGAVTIALAPALIVPPSELTHLLFSYEMYSGPCPGGSTYRFQLIGAQLSGVNLVLPISSCTKTCSAASSAEPASWGAIKSIYR